ncbi:Lysosome membrane protein 2 [Clonorchis sinensis]|uniref:Lysosome membrane protein 2 n=2 Tax=Clonorchis sinensis TaxID=79923 RepID=A0A8T1M0H2_CLOSI|nr:Lysosome membrane protein 2 [Clonorchis sinensis]GAA56005.1 lysosome membrane protein 2 [Clonorchis sinensis]
MTIRSKPLRITLIVAAALFIVIALFTLILVLIFDRLFLALLAQKLAISPNSPVYESWLVPTVPIYFSVYLLNLTNPTEVLAGARPHLEEVGPYVYRERRERFDVQFGNGSESHTVRFKYRIFYYFDRNKSINDPSTVRITTPNLYFLVMTSSNMGWILGDEGPFITLTAEEVMWGYTPALVSFLRAFFGDKKVGLFATNNGTNVNEFVVNTGAKNIQDIGKIYEVNGQQILDIWDNLEANMLNGTDGTVAAPGLRVGSTVEFHVPDICRSVTSYAVDTTTTQERDDVEVTVFSGSPPNSTDPLAKWRTDMFCTKDSGCPPQGLLSLQRCAAKKGADLPLFLSQPFFLGADPQIAAAFDGLPVPSKEKYSTWVHIEPTTGFVLEAFKRIQFNIFMENTDSKYKDMKGPYYFPIAWIAEIAVADKKSVDMLANMVLAPRKKVPLILTIVGAISTVLAVTLIVILVACVRTRSISHRAKRNGTVSPASPVITTTSTKESHIDTFTSVTSPWSSTKPRAPETQVTEAKPLLHSPSHNDPTAPVA